MHPPTEKTREQPGDPARYRGELPEGGADIFDPASAGAEAYKPLARPRKRLTAGVLGTGAVLLATLAFFGYHVYDMFNYVDIPFEKADLSTTVSGGVKEIRGPNVSGSIGRKAAAGDDSLKKVDRGKAPFAVPEATSATGSTNAARTPADTQHASRQTAPARPASERGSPRAEPCTEGIAAVGLCSTKPGPTAKPGTTAVAGPAIALPQASTAREAVDRAKPRAVPCTEGVAALGLCTPEIVQGKE